MEPKSAMEIISSPEGLIILPIAVIIDLIGIILVLFGLDDFWTTDIIAWVMLGGWSYLRSQIVPEPVAVQMPSVGAKQELAAEAQKTAQEVAKSQKMTKAAKWGKRLKWLEFIPYVGALPLWTVSVYMTIKYS